MKKLADLSLFESLGTKNGTVSDLSVFNEEGVKWRILRGWCDTEEDVYGEGCIPNSGISWEMDIKGKTFNSPKEAMAAACADQYVKYNREYMSVDDFYDDSMAVTLQTLVDVDNNEADAQDIEEWKAGKKRLWVLDMQIELDKITAVKPTYEEVEAGL